ncbi:Proliferating cell nuclear antigen, C-terminal domain [seawater metagenome]|uniref:Proliferating cell nuclear antigen, C-terminal domain n=1 Tax=seawater metagenome TaxID=1561972 RepID=A0A5E8CIE6_9ZZZZ
MVYILELKTVQSGAFKTLVEALKEILNDVNFEFSPYYLENESSDTVDKNDSDSDSEINSDESDSDDENVKSKNVVSKNKKVGGLKVMAVNKTQTILIHLKLDADKFDYYYCARKKLILGINMLNFYRLIKTMSNFDTLTLAVDDEDINKLIIKLENGDKNCVSTYKLNLMDLDVEDIEVEPAKFPYSINMLSVDFHKICKDMHNIAEKIEIKCTSKKIYFHCKGEMASLETELGETANGLSIDVYHDEIVQGLFELKNLVLFTKCTNLCNTVTLYIKNDYPLVIKYSVAALGEIKLCLSPNKPKDSYEYLS